MLDWWAHGKAECWPSNESIAVKAGLKERAVIYVLRELEVKGAIRCIKDGSLPTRRRIVFLGHPGTKEVLQRHTAKDCNPRCKKRRSSMQSKSNDLAPECKRSANEQEKETPVAGPADRGPADDQAPDWLARLSPALRARFQGLLEELSEDS
jgi:succinylglutamate desuccinylase